MADLPKAPDLVTITTPGGARFTVAKAYRDQFQGLVNDLEKRGYTIDPSQSGGYNPRMIAGTKTPSFHASGQAIDVNWRQNPRGGGQSTIPPDVARELAQRYNMTWGGDWSGETRDPMHFEVAQGTRPAFSMASVPTPQPPAGPMGGDLPLASPTPPAPVPTQARLLPPGMLPTLPGQPSSLADAFAEAAGKARQSQTYTPPSYI